MKEITYKDSINKVEVETLSGQEGKRFVVQYVSDETPMWGRDYYYRILDTKTNTVIGTDHCEPEDAILCRDFSWVSKWLNILAEEIYLLLQEKKKNGY